jgi:Rieske Fe-S protein
VTQEPRKDSLATRRGMLAGVGLVGLAGAITACSSSGSSMSAAVADPATSTGTSGMSTATASAPASASASASSAAGGSAAGALTATSAIPVGGGKIFADQTTVVTQPSAGEFKVFSAVCTHMGCIVNQIADGRIDCPCHGSEYSITDGAVLAGPAPKPLPAKPFKVTGDSIFLE